MTRREILLLVCVLGSACGPEVVPTQSAEPPASGTPTTAPTAASIDWTLVDLPDALGQWSASGVIADTDEFVVYGGVNDRPAAWTSVDGLVWRSFALPGLGAGEGALPGYAAATDDATVLLGVGGTPQCAHPSREYLWRRPRGDETWVAVPFVEALFCQGGLPALAADDEGFVVAGTNVGEIPFAWHSVDGQTWRDTGAGLPVDAPPAVLAAVDDGFLALGRGSRTDAEASSDGTSWAMVPAPPVPPAFDTGGGVAMAPWVLINTAHGPLAIYESDDGLHSAWRRLPDASWAAVPLERLVPPGIVSGGASVGERTLLFLIAGGQARLVQSTDLVTWADVPIPPLTSINGIAALGGQLVLVGTVVDVDGDARSQVWTAGDPAAAP